MILRRHRLDAVSVAMSIRGNGVCEDLTIDPALPDVRSHFTVFASY